MDGEHFSRLTVLNFVVEEQRLGGQQRGEGKNKNKIFGLSDPALALKARRGDVYKF